MPTDSYRCSAPFLLSESTRRLALCNPFACSTDKACVNSARAMPVAANAELVDQAHGVVAMILRVTAAVPGNGSACGVCGQEPQIRIEIIAVHPQLPHGEVSFKQLFQMPVVIVKRVAISLDQGFVIFAPNERSQDHPDGQCDRFNHIFEVHRHAMERARMLESDGLQSAQPGTILVGAASNQSDSCVSGRFGNDTSCFSLRPVKERLPQPRLVIALRVN